MAEFDDHLSSSEEAEAECFIEYLLSGRGYEFFCEIDEDYILDKFNLTGISSEVYRFQYAHEMLTDNFNHDVADDMRQVIENSARHLYGLIHARFIVTPRGITKMAEKYAEADFGLCPRVFCHHASLLPIGLSDACLQSPVRLYCPSCEDVYTPKSARYANIDGAYFGTSFPHLFLASKPDLAPSQTKEQYEPKVFGFRLHNVAKLHRRREANSSRTVPRFDSKPPL